ncbi:MAG: hypothetical protein AABZ60_07000 [Planctomycetota bacterium]
MKDHSVTANLSRTISSQSFNHQNGSTWELESLEIKETETLMNSEVEESIACYDLDQYRQQVLKSRPSLQNRLGNYFSQTAPLRTPSLNHVVRLAVQR